MVMFGFTCDNVNRGLGITQSDREGLMPSVGSYNEKKGRKKVNYDDVISWSDLQTRHSFLVHKPSKARNRRFTI